MRAEAEHKARLRRGDFAGVISTRAQIKALRPRVVIEHKVLELAEAILDEDRKRINGLSAQLPSKLHVAEAALTASARKSLPKSSFVFPDKAPGSGSYPIHDKAHAANALARSSGKSEAGAVKAAVCKRYPDLPACGGKSTQEAASENGGGCAGCGK